MVSKVSMRAARALNQLEQIITVGRPPRHPEPADPPLHFTVGVTVSMRPGGPPRPALAMFLPLFFAPRR